MASWGRGGGTWHTAQQAVLYWRQGEAKGGVLRAQIAKAELRQQGGGRGLQAEAALQHRRLSGRRLGGQVRGHETLELLPQLLGRGARAVLGLTPRALQPMERLVHLHHLVVEPVGWAREDGNSLRKSATHMTGESECTARTSPLYHIWFSKVIRYMFQNLGSVHPTAMAQTFLDARLSSRFL